MSRKPVCIDTWERRDRKSHPADTEAQIGVLVRNSIYTMWQIGRYPREIGRHHGIGDNAVCDVVRELASEDTSRRLKRAWADGRLSATPNLMGLRRVA